MSLDRGRSQSTSRAMPGGIKTTTFWLRVCAVLNTCDELAANQSAGKPFKAQVKGRTLTHLGSLELWLPGKTEPSYWSVLCIHIFINGHALLSKCSDALNKHTNRFGSNLPCRVDRPPAATCFSAEIQRAGWENDGRRADFFFSFFSAPPCLARGRDRREPAAVCWPLIYRRRTEVSLEAQ